ncbi:hypothetical protein Tco_0215841 [Tanacetum coccineum]
MAQQIIPAAQLVPKFQGIGRCNNYAMLQSISCSPECKIMGQILLDHPLIYALTATADIVYTVDIFRDTLKLPVKTPDNPFVAPVNIEIIESFMHMVGYQGVVDKDFFYCVKQKKNVIMYPRFTKLIFADLMKKYPSIPLRHEEDYHSIKDDILLTGEIRATDNYKEYETVFINVDVPMNQPQSVVSTQGTHKSTPRAHRTPTLTASPQGKKRKQSAGETNASMIHDDVDDSGDRIEPDSHKEHPKVVVDDDDDNKDEKKDDEMGIHGKVDRVLYEIVPQLAKRATNDLIEGNLKRVVADTIIEERDDFQAEDVLKQDDAPPEGEKRVKRHKTSKSSKSDAWEEKTFIDEDEVVPEDETPELITEFQNVDKHVLTIFDRARIKATLNDMLSNQFRNAKEYAYHLEQETNFMENQIV